MTKKLIFLNEISKKSGRNPGIYPSDLASLYYMLALRWAAVNMSNVGNRERRLCERVEYAYIDTVAVILHRCQIISNTLANVYRAQSLEYMYMCGCVWQNHICFSFINNTEFQSKLMYDSLSESVRM